MLPASDQGFTLVIGLVTKGIGSRQDLVSWARADGSLGCVSLYLDTDGTVVYAEFAEEDGARDALFSGGSLADGARYVVTVSRSAGGITYLYVDGAVNGQGLIKAPRPSLGLSSAPAVANTCLAAGPGGFAFQGVVLGLELYDRGLSAWEIARTSGASLAPTAVA